MNILKNGLITLILASSMLFLSGAASAQDVNDIRWKSEAQVKAVLGEPNSVSTPIGTHATYTLWQYNDFTVAFANSRAFHLFNKDSLQKVNLNEDRPN
jgi:hypothetical protein